MLTSYRIAALALALGSAAVGAQSTARAAAPVNPISQIIGNAELLQLTDAQIDTLASHNAVYLRGAAEVWTTFERSLDSLTFGFDPIEVALRLDAALTRVTALLAREATVVRGALTTSQVKALPAALATTLDAAAIGNPVPAPEGR